MTEYEEIDGVLVQVCDHEFSNWYSVRVCTRYVYDEHTGDTSCSDFAETSKRDCSICRKQQYMQEFEVVRETVDSSKELPEKLPMNKRWWNW